MSRTVSQTLLDAISNQQGETILRVKTWLDLAAYNAAPTVPEQTWQTNKFKISGTEAEAALISEDNDYTVSDFTVFVIERGVSISGVEYVTQSGLYFVTNFTETAGRIKVSGSSFPDQKIIIDGDDTYENVITAFCTEIGKTAVFKDTGAAWLDYQFLATGKQVILNKAERFLNLIRQKYLIQCYERSPKELVFYHATTEQSAWKDIIYNDSLLILTASSGSHETARSADGLAYTKTDAPHFTNAVAYSPSLDLFAAVGDGVAMSSPDGVTWTTRTIEDYNWTGITWDSSIALFVAVAIGATARSANGTTWTITYLNSYSHTWTTRTMPSGYGWVAAVWSPELEIFAAIAYPDGGTSKAATSADGITWTERTLPEGDWRDICWSPELSLFVAVSNQTNYVATSPDGTTWTARTGTLGLSGIVWSAELALFVAVGAKAYTSTNGTSWTETADFSGNTYYKAAWSPALSLFVIVGAKILSSPDGTTWTERDSTNLWNDVTCSIEQSLFVAVLSAGAGSRIKTSSNGTSWTSRTTPNIDYYSVIWCKDISLFVAGGANDIITSPDGTTWTQRTIATGSYTYLAFSQKLLRLLAGTGTKVETSDITGTSLASVATDGVGTLAAVGVDSAYTSVNGSSWTSRTIPAGTYHKIIYANSLFIAVGASKCATSPDGITWTERTIPAGTYTALAYSPTLDLFLAMGDNLAATSPDGITWTSRTAPANQIWTAVTWADTLAVFIAVSSDGDNRIASSTDGINWQILTAQADYSLSYLDGPTSSIIHGTNTVHYISRDETASVNTEGDTSFPAWNLGYLESTASAPATNTDPFYKFFLQKAPLRLDITDGDRIHFEPSWTLDPTLPIDAMTTIIEIFDSTKSPAWYQEIRSLALFDSVEGGSLPSTIERVAAYTPLVSSGFDGNLTPSVNNLQALAEAVDDLVVSGGTPPPTTTAANDFQVGDGAGTWIKKTLAQTITILGIFADAASDSIYYVRRNAGWTNLKTYTDTLYSLLGHIHAASDITSGTMATARLGSGTADNTTYLRGDLTWATPAGGGGRETLSADRTYYVRTDGSDSNDGLTDSAGGAFLTAGKANTVVATIDKNGYDITVQFGAGTWNEDIIINTGIGDGEVTWKGTLTLLEAVTSATVSAGSGATAGTVTKTAQFTGNAYASKIAYFQTDAVYRMILSNTNDALTLADIAASSTAQNVDVYEWGTKIRSLQTSFGSLVNLTYIELTGLTTPLGFSIEINPYTTVNITVCNLYTAFVNGASIKNCTDSYFNTTAASACISIAYSGANAVLRRCLFRAANNSGHGIVCSRNAYALIFGGTVEGDAGGGNKATYGFRVWGTAIGQTTTGFGNLKIRNCDTGLRADTVAGILTSSAVSYTSCTTNTDAVAAQYSYIN